MKFHFNKPLMSSDGIYERLRHHTRDSHENHGGLKRFHPPSSSFPPPLPPPSPAPAIPETDFITVLIIGEIIIQLLGQDRAWTYSSNE